VVCGRQPPTTVLHDSLLLKTLPPCPIPSGLRKYPVKKVENYKRKYRPENNEPKTSTDVEPIRKNPVPTVNNQGIVRKP